MGCCRVCSSGSIGTQLLFNGTHFIEIIVLTESLVAEHFRNTAAFFFLGSFPCNTLTLLVSNYCNYLHCFYCFGVFFGDIGVGKQATGVVDDWVVRAGADLFDAHYLLHCIQDYRVAARVCGCRDGMRQPADS